MSFNQVQKQGIYSNGLWMCIFCSCDEIKGNAKLKPNVGVARHVTYIDVSQ